MDRAYGTTSCVSHSLPVFYTHSPVEAAHFVAQGFNPGDFVVPVFNPLSH